MASIQVPPLGESIVEATVSRWLKNEGDTVAVGDTLVELETDKITVEVSAQDAGVLSARSKREGDVVSVGESLGEIGAGGGAGAPTGAPNGAPTSAPAAAAPVPSAAQSAPAGATSTSTPTTPPAATPAATPAAHDTASAPKVSPAAQRVATEAGIDVRNLEGTGRGGTVSKPDVIAARDAQQGSAPSAAAAPSGSTAPSAPQAKPAASGSPAAPSGQTAQTAPSMPALPEGQRETREKMSTRRKRIAENLLQSQHMTAHLTTFNEIDMTEVTALRERLRDRVEKEQGIKLSFMPFFAKATCLALKAYPIANAQIDGDSIVYKHYVNMGIAVASEAGLVVPNVKDADRKSLIDIGRDINAVAKRARDGKLTMDDLTGGTFTITNGGVFGSLVSTPIINYPQVGILGLHKMQDRPVAIDGKVEIRSMMYIALSYDHRVIDGQQAVLFLVRIKELMEDPAAMLVY